MVASKHRQGSGYSRVLALAISFGIAAGAAGFNCVQPAFAKKGTKTVVKTETTHVVVDTDAAIQGQLAAFGRLLATGDASGLAALWTVDGEYVDEDGAELTSRAAIQKRFAEVFSQEGRPQVTLLSESVKFLAPTVALVEGRVQRNGETSGVANSKFSIVMQRTDGGWLISRLAEHPDVTHTSHDYLRQMEWLLGDWSAKNVGVSVHMRAEYLPNKNFILCRYETQRASGDKTTDIQVIGWDPLQEKPRSWHFDSAGGYGQGFWTKHDKVWACDAEGVEADGSITRSRNLMNVTSPSAFTWSSVHRSVNGMAVGDAPSLEVQRVTQ